MPAGTAGIFLIACFTVVAGGIGTITGFGTSTIMVPVLLLFFPLPQTLLLVGIIHWFSDLWKILLFLKGFNGRLVLLFGLPGVAASYAGARLIVAIDEIMLSRLLGGFLVAYVVFLFANPSFKLRQNAVTALSGGALSGFLAGLFGVGGAARSASLTVFNLEKTAYISTNGAIALLVDFTRVATYLAEGTKLDPSLWWSLLLFIPASFAGAYGARHLVYRIPQRRFRHVVAVFLLIVGLKLLLFPA